MKNRFNWVFEILRSEFFNAAHVYARGADPANDRETLFAALRSAIVHAERRRSEFPDEPQYHLYLDSYVEILEGVLRDAENGASIEPLLAETRKKLAALEDGIRLHLK
ncbi:MAG: hypothetical protein FJY73_06765 [Candidatus Eisenbacteria bacterium]|nr:hypothetical protein [Candidatus Eisenbacteria bacterium]